MRNNLGVGPQLMKRLLAVGWREEWLPGGQWLLVPQELPLQVVTKLEYRSGLAPR